MSADTPSAPHHPMFNAPNVVVALIVLLTVIHVLRGLLPETSDLAVVLNFGFVPARLALAFDPDHHAEIVIRAAESLPAGTATERLAFAHEALGEGELKPWTFVTYAFLHGSWTHLAFNALWLLAFGSPVARRFGTRRFLAFLVVCAAAGAAAHALVHADDVAPMVGASGAISGAMAAASRFALRSDLPMVVLRGDPGLVDRLPAQSLRHALTDQRVVMFLVVWFGTNLFFGLVPGLAEGTIAWEAHLGGFVAGLLLFSLFDPVRRPLTPQT